MKNHLFFAALMLSATALAGEQSPNMDVKQCKAALAKSQKIGLLHDVRTKGPLVTVLVGPTFFKASLDIKEGFAAAVACVLGDGKNFCMPFELQDWRTGKRVGRWSMCKLDLD